MADLDILKTLGDPALSIHSCPKPPTASLETPRRPEASAPQARASGSEDLIDAFESLETLGDVVVDDQITDLSTDKSAIPQQGRECVKHADSSYQNAPLTLTAIENWIELLEAPSKSCIVLAQGNWQARQAATAISIAKKRKTCVLPETICWACVVERHQGLARNDHVVTFIA